MEVFRDFEDVKKDDISGHHVPWFSLGFSNKEVVTSAFLWDLPIRL